MTDVEIAPAMKEPVISVGNGRIRGERTPAHLRTLAHIKNVAAECFYVQGYAATDVRTIADRVGIKVPTLYNYISGKQELLYLIMKDGMVEIGAALDAAISKFSDPRDRLRAAIRLHVLHHAKRQFRAWVSHVEVRSLTGAYLEEILGERQEYERRWISILEDGIRVGVFADANPKLTMYAILAIGQNVARWYKHGQCDAEQIADLMTDLVLHGLLVRS